MVLFGIMDNKNRIELYKQVYKQIEALIKDETDIIAVMATIVCHLHNKMPYFNWTGFYRVISPDILKIGPYQGSLGCLTIPFDRGVCGMAAKIKQTQVVENVDKVPFHIACSATTKSEIVVPVLNDAGQVVAVLDVDSDKLCAFNEIDRIWLKKICGFLEKIYN
ncbi:MAG: GAF domain-containing protein [Bacteroidales bacterium]|nr:GAF domain-containing protein [Bacteroidales bacterium]